MSAEQDRQGLQVEFGAKAGLEILFARRESGDGLDRTPERDVPSELRERYWIRGAEDVGGRKSLWRVAVSMPRWIERQELGRDRNQPGDGFRYVYRRATDGTGSRAEWFEVTEVFEGVEAKDIEAFMRLNNGGTTRSAFDPDGFLQALDMGIPCRAAQRRAADSVVDAVEKKLNKASYEGMWRKHGYGTLIVGLPLWFATIPADPLRVENVIDDFMTRVTTGLRPYTRQLKRKSCPFWRIVVAWMASTESLRELHDRVRYDVYDDPAYRKIGSLPVKLQSSLPLLSEIMRTVERARVQGEMAGGLQLSVDIAKSKKTAKGTSLQLPPAVSALKEALEGTSEGRLLPNSLEQVRWRIKQRVIEVLCFFRVHGLSGFERWANARLSPRHRITRLVMRRRALRLYRASRRR